jgi:hypothetical protein
MKAKREIIKPTDLFKQTVQRLVDSCVVAADRAAAMMFGCREVRIDMFNDEVIAAAVARLELLGISTEKGDFEDKPVLRCSYKPKDPEIAGSDSLRDQCCDQLERTAFCPGGIPVEVAIEKNCPDASVLRVVAELTDADWEVQWNKEKRVLLISAKEK